MEGWQQRLQAEFDELMDRTENLFEFTSTETYTQLPERQQFLLTSQLGVMTVYGLILEQRIKLMQEESNA